jgi:hypothetical protein
VTHFEVFAQRPPDSTLLLPSVKVHQQRLGRTPEWVAGDAAFYSCQAEKALRGLGADWMLRNLYERVEVMFPNQRRNSPQANL